jgi:hypothetical protein
MKYICKGWDGMGLSKKEVWEMRWLAIAVFYTDRSPYNHTIGLAIQNPRTFTGFFLGVIWSQNFNFPLFCLPFGAEGLLKGVDTVMWTL